MKNIEFTFYFWKWKWARGVNSEGNTITEWWHYGPFEFRETRTLQSEGACQAPNLTADGRVYGKCLRPIYNGHCKIHGTEGTR